MGKKSKGAVKEEKMEVDGDERNVLIMHNETVLNTYDDDSDIARARARGKFELKRFLKGIKKNVPSIVLNPICDEKSKAVEMVKEEQEGLLLEFDLIHVDAPIANALRRVLIAEVPTMAIEKIYLYQNTSIIQDEVLCHRIGLLPLYADPRKFEWPKEKVVGINETGVDCEEIPPPDPDIHLVFTINVSCKKKSKPPAGATEPNELYNDSSIYSRSFEWNPIGDQKKKFAADPPRMVHEDILVAKLRPGQEIEAICHCVKGVGRDHAKFSPVATASYRLLPFINLTKEVTGENACKLQSSFSEGVIDVVKNEKGVERAVVVDARRDTCSRNVLRHEELADSVELGRYKDHFIFSVESTGALPSYSLVIEACKVLESKAINLKSLIADALKQVESSA